MAFKVAKMREAIMEDQDEFLMRNSECTDVDVETNTRYGVHRKFSNFELEADILSIDTILPN